MLDAAFAAWRVEDFATAVELFRRAWRHAPGHPQVAYYLGVGAMRMGRPALARSWLARAWQAPADDDLRRDLRQRWLEVDFVAGRTLRARLAPAGQGCPDCGGEWRVIEEWLGPRADRLRVRVVCDECRTRREFELESGAAIGPSPQSRRAPGGSPPSAAPPRRSDA